MPNFKGAKYCILEIFHRTFHWVANEPFLSDSRVISSSSLTGEPLLLKFHVLKSTLIYFKCFIPFQMLKLPFFVFTIKWSDISFSIHQKLLLILSANIMQNYQFKYVSHCLSITNPEYNRVERLLQVCFCSAAL